MYEGRSRVLLVLVVFIAIVFAVRLFYIQVLDDNYKVFAANNSLRKEIIYPSRGLIYDRNGEILVRNITIYDVMVIPAKVKNFDTLGFCRLLELDTADFHRNMRKARAYSKYLPSPVVRQINSRQFGRLQERLFEFRGFYVQPRTARTYTGGLAAHAIGYLGEVNDKEIEKGEKYYRMGDYIGKSGLEKSYEDKLRGEKGVRYILVDVLNREQGRYMDGQEDIPSIAGYDMISGMDKELQEYGEKLMAGKKGSIVAIDPSTGEILAMISAPAYDPNQLMGRERAKNYAALITNPDKPMFNRAISAMYPPGSTVKPVEALIGMDQDVIGPHFTYTCSGGYRIGGHTVGCHSAGTFDVSNSIRLSCNSYYCNLFRMIIEQPAVKDPAQGLDRWAEGLKLFGLGIKTGLDIPNENKGILPTSAMYNKFYGEGRWKATTIISLGIGQGEISLTPLQLANEAATIANMGYYITPHFASAFRHNGQVEKLEWPRHETGIDTAYFRLVKNAMQDVVERGTAGSARITGIVVCGKTGTAQNPHGEDHSVFIAFAPKDHPKIAIAAIIENAGYGGSWAAPAASLMIEKYLNDSTSRAWLEKKILDAAYLKKNVEVAKTGQPHIKTEPEND